MANIITELHLEMSDNWYVSKKLNSIGRVGENTVTKLIIEPTEIINNVTYELEIMSADGSKNVAELTVDGTELYLILTANMLTTSGITKMQVRGLFTDGSIKKSNIFELKVNRSISATEAYEEYAVIIFDQLVQDCRDIIEGAESYAVRAETAAVNAEAYEQSASASADAASTSATTASTASTTATTAAGTATAASVSASTSAETATTAATSASASASNASTSAQTAQSASVTAQSASEAAQTASTAATSAQTAAETAASTATTSASNASASATAAANSATAASTSATSASASATSAATSETNAAASAALASTSATNAANSATSAAASATNAHNSEVNASASETNASTSAAEAEASAESIAASAAQISENTYRINDLEAIIAGYQLTDLPTGQIATVTDGTALLMPSLKVGIEPVQSGSGDPSPDNIRPISGWTAANISVKGINVWDEEWEAGGISTSNGQDISLNAIRSKGYSSCKPSTAYYAKFTADGYIFWYDADKNYISNSYSSASVRVIQSPDNAYWFRIRKDGITTYNNDISINYPSTDTSYHAYNGTTYNIQFTDGDNPLTVYGGTLDVTSGELVVDRVYKEFDGTENWTRYATSEINTVFILYSIIPNAIIPLNPISSQFNYNSRAYEIASNREYTYNLETSGTRRLFMQIPTSLASTDEAFKAWLATQKANDTPVTISVRITSITYHLTPTQVRTLVGNNNIWADTGDIIEGKYYRSPF